MSDYYPAGVTDAHPHFNPAPVSATAVECGADEALVIPSFAVKAALNEFLDWTKRRAYVAKSEEAKAVMGSANARIEKLLEQITALEQEHEYECPFSDEIDLEESECAQWVCPTCGNDRETDNAPEERDPDEEWERRNGR